MIIFIIVYSLLSSFLFKNTPENAFKLRRLFLKFAYFILGISVKIEGIPSEEPALYVSNHRSLSDPLINLKTLDAYVIAKAEVAKIPVLSTGAKLTGILYVKRENKKSRSAVREMMVNTLLNGHNILVYPEGTVNGVKKITGFRPGTFNEAVKNNIPVVPMVIEYKSKKDVWTNRSLMSHFFLQFGKLRTQAWLVIGKTMTNTDGDQLRQEVQEWTNVQIERIHNNWDSYFSKHTTAEV